MDRLNIQPKLQSALPVRWEIAADLVPYDEAVARMEREVAAIAKGEAPELVWLLEHPALYTAGTSAKDSDLISPRAFRCIIRVAAGNTPIMDPAKGWPMSCLI